MAEIKNLVVFTFYGEGVSVAEKAKAEGLDTVVARIENHDDILVPEENKKPEDPKEKKRRMMVGKGMVPIVDAEKAVQQLLKVPMEERESYFLFFDINVGFKFAQKLYNKGFNGNFPTQEDREFEVDRKKGKDFVKKYYTLLQVGEVKEFKKIEDAIQFVEESDESWAIKGYDDNAETVVPTKNDPEKNRLQTIAALNSGKADYEKSGFILERKIDDPIELTPQCVFYDGKPVYYSLDIELKKIGAGDTGRQCGCAANLVMGISPDDPICRVAFPDKVYQMAKERKGMYIWDASILIDPKDGRMYFGEFCPNRFGWDCIQTEMTMAGGVKKYLQSIIDGQVPFPVGTYGFAVRIFGEKEKEIAIAVEPQDIYDEYVWPLYAYKGTNGVMTTGYSDDAVVVTCDMGELHETIAGAFEYIDDNISMQDAYYRPLEDILSYSYPSSILNRHDYAIQNGLIKEGNLSKQTSEDTFDSDEALKELLVPVVNFIHKTVSQQRMDMEDDFNDRLSLERKGYIKKLKSLFE